MKITYQDYISDGGVAIGPGQGTFWSDTWEQPQEFAIGIANNSLLDGNLQLNADVIYKDYSSAEFYKDFYRDQTVFALGAQLTTGKAKWRLGYSYAREPLKRNLDPGLIGIGDQYTIGAPGGGQINVNGEVVEYFQATNAGAVWENSVSAGFGYPLLPNLAVVPHAAFPLNNEVNLCSPNNVEEK